MQSTHKKSSTRTTNTVRQHIITRHYKRPPTTINSSTRIARSWRRRGLYCEQSTVHDNHSRGLISIFHEVCKRNCHSRQRSGSSQHRSILSDITALLYPTLFRGLRVGVSKAANLLFPSWRRNYQIICDEKIYTLRYYTATPIFERSIASALLSSAGDQKTLPNHKRTLFITRTLNIARSETKKRLSRGLDDQVPSLPYRTTHENLFPMYIPASL